VAEYSGVAFTTVATNDVQDQLFGKSHTFRKGQVDSWRDELGGNHKEAIAEDMGEFLIKFGYEKDLSLLQNWYDSHNFQSIKKKPGRKIRRTFAA